MLAPPISSCQTAVIPTRRVVLSTAWLALLVVERAQIAQPALGDVFLKNVVAVFDIGFKDDAIRAAHLLEPNAERTRQA